MNYIAIENKLHDILQRACHYSDMATAERAKLRDERPRSYDLDVIAE